MLRTPTFKQAMQRHVLAISLALCLPFLAKADLGITLQMNQVGDQVTADALVYNFSEILSMQFTITWDTSELEFVSVGDFNLQELSPANFGLPSNIIAGNGHLTISWSDPIVEGISFPDCGSIFRITFHSVNGQVPPLYISNDPTPVEVVNSNFEFLDIISDLGCGDLGKASGKVFKDNNDNCTNDGDDLNLEGWQVKFVVDKLPYYATTDANGNYSINCPAGYCEATVLFPEDGHIWEVCQPVSGFQLAENQEIELVFGTHDLGTNENPSGIFELNGADFSVKILPNPVKSAHPIFIETTSENARQLSFQIFDASGKLLGNSSQNIAVGTSKVQVANHLEAGIYILKTTDENGNGLATKLMVF